MPLRTRKLTIRPPPRSRTTRPTETKILAARIGPTVWLEEGPTPIENKSVGGRYRTQFMPGLIRREGKTHQTPK